jgi:transposase
MWTTENRPRYERKGLRYPSDLTDAESELVKPLIPRAKRGGRKRQIVVRDVLNGILYVLSTACQWRALPKDLPPRGTVHGCLQRWDYDGTLTNTHDALYVACRDLAEREISPTACMIDSQSVKSTGLGREERTKGGPRSIRPDVMRARKSKARSDMSWSTRSA